MRYAFVPPERWTREPFPPPQRGVYLRAPVAAPSPESASILLFEAVTARGSLEEQLAILVKESCEGAKIVKGGKPEPRTTRGGYHASSVQVAVEVPAGGKKVREEQRVFVLVDTGADRLPIAFVGGARSLAAHAAAFDAVVASIGPLLVEPTIYTRWVE